MTSPASRRWEVGLSRLRRAEDPDRGEQLRCAMMFFATWGTVAGVHATLWSRSAPDLIVWLRASVFACALLGILLTHEFGHRFAAHHLGMPVSWPLFLPAPLLFGTFGALLGLRAPPRDRESLLAMALAGPIAGLLGAGVLLALDQAVPPFPAAAGAPPVSLALPLGWRAAAAVGLAPHCVDPADPIAFAVWIAVWITGANLLPFGQLDGGHIFTALFPAWSRAAGVAVGFALLVAGLAWSGWWIWGLTLWALGGANSIVPERHGAPTRSPAVLAALAVVACVGSIGVVPYR